MTNFDETAGTLLGGRVRYAQFAAGHRSGLEPVLMAAAVPAQPGARVLELGTGAGAAMLCLLARVAGVSVLGVERDPALAALAARNLAANGFTTGFAVAGDAAHPPAAGFDHAMANPPWHDETTTPSPDPGRQRAHRGRADLPGCWCRGLAGALKPRGTLTLALPATGFATWTTALRAANFGGLSLIPLWPRAGAPAKLILLQARLASRGAERIHPGLPLHAETGFTAEAEAILRDGAAFPTGS